MWSYIRTSAAPPPIKKAAGLIVAYGFFVLVGAIWFALESDFSDMRGFTRAVVRFGGLSITAWGLVSLQKWAWWLAVSLCGFFFIMGLIGVVALGILVTEHNMGALRQILSLGVPLYLLGHALFILLQPSIRQWFWYQNLRRR